MKNNKLLFLIFGILIVAVLSFIINNVILKHSINIQSVTPNKNKKLQITASFYPLYFFAREIGGNKAEVKNITPAGSEPHDYEPTAKEIAYIENSDIFISNGGRFEPWRDRVINNFKIRKTTLVTPAEDLITNNDPHVWLSPRLAIKEMKPIKEAFILVDPANKSIYEENTRQLIEKLSELDRQYERGLRNCTQKDIITSHAAFGYLTASYGLNQVSISGLSIDSEPSSQQLVQVINFAKSHNVKYIFFESLVSPKLSDTIANEIGAKTLVLNPLEGLTEDDIKQGKDYFTIMEDNLKNLQIALQCSN